MATTSGPPARPSLTGVGIPGNAMGRLPHRIPRKMPTNNVIMFGSLRRFKELPSTLATRSTASSEPTTMTRSPTCSIRLGLANRSTPERLTRVMLTLYMLRKFSIPSFFPFISGLVTKIRRDTIGISCFSQSTCTSRPIKATMASESSSEHTTNNWSFCSRIVPWFGMLTPFRILTTPLQH